VPVPDAPEAEERAWRVVSAAFAAREPVPRRRRSVRPLVLAAAALAVVALAVSSPGRAVLGSLREQVGVKHAAPALFKLPTGGRLLVDAANGPWIVEQDGSKRHLGNWEEASWSPHGKYVAVTRGHELAALDPKGNVRWSLARPGHVRGARWSPAGANCCRIAYLSGTTLRLVAGDKTGDHLLARDAAPVAPAWLPVPGKHVLAYATADGAIHVVEADTGRVVSASRPPGQPRALAWTPDGRDVVVLYRSRVSVAPAGDGTAGASLLPPGPHAFTVAPRARSFALTRATPTGGTEVVRYDARTGKPTRRIFVGPGDITGLAWSPDGRWLLLGWESAGQWVFVHASGKPEVRAVSNVAAQFGGSFPSLAGWCCAD
jgi:dipeptidyl aminopeptidase/acylaminoacyl peptidase